MDEILSTLKKARKIRWDGIGLSLMILLGATGSVPVAAFDGVDFNSRPARPSARSKSMLLTASALDRAEDSQAEAGLKLLINIFNRLGNEPQLALKNEIQSRSGDMRLDKKQIASANSQFGGVGGVIDQDALNNSMPQLANNTDPALAIRPQSSRRVSVGRAVLSKTTPVDTVTIAMARDEGKSYTRAMLADKAGHASGGAAGADLKVASLKAAETNDAEQEKSADSSVMLKRASRSEEISSLRKKQVAIPYLAGSTRAVIVPMQDQNHIREFKGEIGMQNADDARVSDYRTTGFAGSKEVTLGESDAGIIRPSEQPGLFKYVKEHKQQQLPTDTPREAFAKDSQPATKNKADLLAAPMPVQASAAPASPVAEKPKPAMARFQFEPNTYNIKKGSIKRSQAQQIASGELAGKLRQTSYGTSNNMAPPLVAFLPPSTIRGISGLALGSKEAETLAFVKARGKFKTTQSHGWKVYTLLSSDNTVALQAYVHNGYTEALRVFQQNLVPQSIGVNIDDQLSEMKSKFGEPSFILEEPRSADSEKTIAKNYVYPLSQLGFQLARPASGAKPEIKSVLLFRYL